MENDRTVFTRPVVSEYGPVRRHVQRYRKVLGIGLLAMLVVVAFVGFRLIMDERAEAERLDKLNSAEQRLRAFAEAWTSGQPTAAGRVTDSPTEAESLLASVTRNLKPKRFRIHVGEGRIEETAGQDGVVIPFTVSMEVPRVGRFEYASTARLVRPSREQLRTSGTNSDGQPVIQFTPAVVHPELKKGQTLAVAKTSERGEIRDRNGDVLTAPSLVGQVDESTGRGVSGLQKRYDEQLRGTGPAYAVALTDRDTGEAVKPLVSPGTKAGRDVRTTIDPAVQRAAADALQGTDTSASLVALRPSSGDVLAVANRPGGFNRALVGQYPPGSTFKVVSAA
ncbi:MAG TPA: NTF2-like N-terminal transpeptidase domain-containing protein, partial [Actinopolymorphaceae bacterium]